MKKIKLVLELIKKAENSENGVAKINGRMFTPYVGYGELREKYKVVIDKNGILEFYHWGTKTLTLDIKGRTVIEYFGMSVSDRDSLNNILYHFNVKGGFTYRPSINEFSYID